MPFNRNMLNLARELRAMTQADLEAESGVSQPKISKIEGGVLTPTDDELTKIAAALRLPLPFFEHRGPRPARGSTCLYHRKKQSARVRDLNRIHAQFAYMRMQVDELLAGVKIGAARSIFQIDIDSMNGDVEKIAAIVRQTWGIPSGPVDNLTIAIEHAGIIVIRTPFDSNHIAAMSYWPDAGPPVIFVNAESPGDMLRFSLAHELGHLIMHAVPVGDIEREANRFAAEFLMPRASVLSELASGPVTLQKLAALKLRWKVSIQALIVRAHDLSVITDRQYRSLMVQVGKMGWRTSEPVRVEPEEPTVLRSIIDHYVHRKGYSTADLCSLTMSLEPEFRRRFLGEDTQRVTGGLRLAQN